MPLRPAAETPARIVGHRQQQVRFVEMPDDLVSFEHRQLRNVVQPHPRVGDSQRLVGPDADHRPSAKRRLIRSRRSPSACALPKP